MRSVYDDTWKKEEKKTELCHYHSPNIECAIGFQFICFFFRELDCYCQVWEGR